MKPTRPHKVRTDGARIFGKVGSRQKVTVTNLTAASFGPTQMDHMVSSVRADAQGNFSLLVPAARSQDQVRLKSGKSLVDIRLDASTGGRPRKAQPELQGFRLRINPNQESASFQQTRKSSQVGKPFAPISFVNARTDERTTINLTAEGQLPKKLKLSAEVGDTFLVYERNSTADFTRMVVLPEEGFGTAKPHVEHRNDVVRVDHEGPFIRDGMGVEDVIQGEIGNCWLASSVAAIVETNAKALRKCIRKLKGDNYQVTFQRYDPKTDSYHPEKVKVNDHLLEHKEYDAPNYAATEGLNDEQSMELWWPILEKAYAAWRGGFDGLDGGNAYAVFEALFGNEGEHVQVEVMSPGKLAQSLQKALEENRPIVACTRGDRRRVRRQGLATNHAYSLHAVEIRPEGLEIAVRDPYGPWGYAERDEQGLTWVPLADFHKQFSYVSYGPELK